jgi:hypothetical protein
MIDNKYELRVVYRKDMNIFYVSKDSVVDKLLKLVEIYYEDIVGTEYRLLHGDVELNRHRLKLLSDVFTVNGKGSDIVELVLFEEDEIANNIIFECKVVRGEVIDSRTFRLNKRLSFQKLKFNLLTCFPNLEMEYYTINYNGIDISDIYGDNKLIGDIFKETIVTLELTMKPKLIVEYHKRCHFCFSKADNICKRCALANCNNCAHKDPHSLDRATYFVEIKNFKDYETATLLGFLKDLGVTNQENLVLDSNNFNKTTNDKIIAMERKFEELVDLINTLKNIQINNLRNNIDHMWNKYKPEGIELFIDDFIKRIKVYQKEPFVDCEESDRKLLSFEHDIKTFEKEFVEYKSTFNDTMKKYINCIKLDTAICDQVKSSIADSRLLFKPKEDTTKYNKIMKVYDYKSILVFDNNKATEKFTLMLFNDKGGAFRDNFSNYVQFNFESKLFIVTGTPCQKLFCYDLTTNEMELISTMKYNHNWWPVLHIAKLSEMLPEITIFCISGSYTKLCEELTLKPYETSTLEWADLPNTNVAHGQASSFIMKNMLYILYGYDYNFSSIANVERLDLSRKTMWENIAFKNPNSIESILYYHANLHINDDCFILGGLKTVEENDLIYTYRADTDSLLKTEYNFNLCPKEVRFCNEKNFIDLTVHEAKDIDLGKKLIIGSNGILNCSYALFDIKNNIHFINLTEGTKMEYKFIQFKN